MQALQYFVEIEKFGEGAWLTASFLILTALVIWQWVAYVRQNATIWTKKSAVSVDPSIFIYSFLMMAGATYYGFATQRLTIFLTGTMAFIMAPIVVGIWRFGRIKRRDRVMLWVGLAWLLAYFFFDPRFVYAVFSVGGIVPFWFLFNTLRETKSQGELQVGWMIPLAGKIVMWIIYAYSPDIRDIVYMVAAPTYLLLLLVVMALWYYYGWKEKQDSQAQAPELQS